MSSFDKESILPAEHSGLTVFDFGLCQAIRACFAGNAEQGFRGHRQVA